MRTISIFKSLGKLHSNLMIQMKMSIIVVNISFNGNKRHKTDFDVDVKSEEVLSRTFGRNYAKAFAVGLCWKFD